MENSLYIDSSTSDSRQDRSRSNSHLSSTTTEFEGLNIHNPSYPHQQRTTLPSILPLSSQAFVEQVTTKPFVSTSVPQQLTPFPLLSDEDLNASWSFLPATKTSTGTTPQLRFDPAPPVFQEPDPRIIRSNSIPATMSTLGIQQYDQRFDTNMHTNLRHTYTWPQFELHEQMFPQDSSRGISPAQLTPTLFEEPKLMPSPSYAKSLSSSPPRAILTPEQRELKRQRDYARRDSKTQMRRERSTSNTSNPYVVSQNTSPDMLPKTLPEFTNSLTPSPLLSQGSLQNSPALGSTGFLSPYPPQVNDQVPTDIYGPVFTMHSNEFTSAPQYSLPYSTSGADASLHAFIGRPHSLSLSSMPDHSSVYRTQQVSPKVGSSDSGDQVRVVHSRPKPQCWEHGCNGRQFSTFSNLLRHQREKSGAAQKSSCPNCGAEFTRTTARNGHMAHDKCKQRRNS